MPAEAQQRENEIHFHMVRSAAATNAGCLPNAAADVEVKSLGPVEKMRVRVKGLPPHTDFDFFVIQVPNAPFGMSWYQGDIETDGHGRGHRTFVGRFNIETFIVAPDTAPAPVVHDQPIPTPPATRRPRRCTRTTWACGSTRRRMPPRPAARTR